MAMFTLYDYWYFSILTFNKNTNFQKTKVWNGGINLDMEKDVNLNMIWTNSMGLKYIQNIQEMNFQNGLWNVILGSLYYVFTQMQLLKVS